jgi:hypothetical protein
MTKLAKIEQKTFQNKPSGFTVAFDDNRSGNMDEKQSDKGLRVGDNVIVTEIPYTSKAGNTSTLYGVKLDVATIKPQSQPLPPAQTPPQPNKLSLTVSSLSEAKASATIKAMEFMVDCFIADKITWDQIQPKHKELTGYLYDAIDECNS